MSRITRADQLLEAARGTMVLLLSDKRDDELDNARKLAIAISLFQNRSATLGMENRLMTLARVYINQMIAFPESECAKRDARTLIRTIDTYRSDPK